MLFLKNPTFHGCSAETPEIIYTHKDRFVYGNQTQESLPPKQEREVQTEVEVSL